jgi:hypothetical protein
MATFERGSNRYSQRRESLPPVGSFVKDVRRPSPAFFRLIPQKALTDGLRHNQNQIRALAAVGVVLAR